MNNQPTTNPQTVSQFFGTHPKIDAFNLLPQFKVEYVYPDNYTTLTIKCPADAIALFRAVRANDNVVGYMGANQIYVLLLRHDRVLSIQLVDITTNDICGLSIPKVARLAYISDATHLILFSTHNHQEVVEMPSQAFDMANGLRYDFSGFDLDLIDYIRVGQDAETSAFSDSWDGYTRIPPTHDEEFNYHRDYQIYKAPVVNNY